MKVAFSTVTLVAVMILAGSASAEESFSAYPGADGIPQPHLLAARKLAEQDNTWSADILTACYVEQANPAQALAKDPPPTRMMDNLYYVGNAKSDVWAINTSDGLILVDSLNNEAMVDQFIIGGLQKLGLDPSRIKALIITHVSVDHAGGASYLQNKYHAKVYMGAAEWDYASELAKGDAVAGFRQGGDRGRQGEGFVAPMRDVTVNDGDVLTMGDTTIKMFVTPAHSRGQLAMLIPLTYQGQPHTFVFVGASSRAGLSLATHDTFDRTLSDFTAAAGRSHADGVLSDHSNYDEMPLKVALMRANPGGSNPFIIGPEATMRWLQIIRECNLNNRDIDAALGARKSAANR